MKGDTLESNVQFWLEVQKFKVRDTSDAQWLMFCWLRYKSVTLLSRGFLTVISYSRQDLCHAHAQPALIHRKVQTIIDCFLNSAIAPELQIDIPIEMADKLMERLSGRTPSLHPYVFREAQVRKATTCLECSRATLEALVWQTDSWLCGHEYTRSPKISEDQKKGDQILFCEISRW